MNIIRSPLIWALFFAFFDLSALLAGQAQLPAPTGLMCEFLTDRGKITITDAVPEFGWIVNSDETGDSQTAYHILVASTRENLRQNVGDMWDSGKVSSDRSIDIEYGGKPLSDYFEYYWKSRIWNKTDRVSDFSRSQIFYTGDLKGGYETARYPLQKREVVPVRLVDKGGGHFFVDFGRAAFGTLRVKLMNGSGKNRIEIHLGEKAENDDTVSRNPEGTIRYRKMEVKLDKGINDCTVTIPADERNTGAKAVKMPPEIGEVMPFRYCEIIGSPSPIGESDILQIAQIAVNYPFDPTASSFASSDTVLNAVWDLCKYSIQATSFLGVYVDGDRERIPYEADALINQLGHYCVDREYSMGRYTHEYLITHPSWPTEWILQSVLMAYTDYQYTGNRESLVHFYKDLKAKTLLALAREDGLISTRIGLLTDNVLESIHSSEPIRDIVDWPPAQKDTGWKLARTEGERDGFVFTEINTVVNAFYYRNLILMAEIARIVGENGDILFFSQLARRVKKAFNDKLLDPRRGIYVDGEGTDHASLHGNMFPLVFDLVPDDCRVRVTDFIKSRGMACSVYGAQFLLEALFKVGEDDYACELMTAKNDRSWWNMIRLGSTITLEAWDPRHKPNLDWNHAWGGAPANILPRCLFGIEPLAPGFAAIQIRPQVGHLRHGRIKMPTIRGPVSVEFDTDKKSYFTLKIEIPANTTARVYIPHLDGTDDMVFVDGKSQAGEREGRFIGFDIGSSQHTFKRVAETD